MTLPLNSDFTKYNDLNHLRRLDRIHPYPAKFPIDLALEFISKYTHDNDIVLDPFCGSGTTLLAAKYLNKNAFGFDVNYVAFLITQAKLLHLTKDDFLRLEQFRVQESDFLQYYENINHWFRSDCIQALSNIKTSINHLGRNKQSYKIFLNLIFSSIINLVSNQESDTRYASIDKKYLSENYVYEKFFEKLYGAIEIFTNVNIESSYTKQEVFLYNSKNLSHKTQKDSISLILTSPPYPNTYDYYLYHKHRMLWLDFNVKFSMQNEIGSRREYSSLKLPKEKFNSDLLEIFKECQIVLKDKGYIVLVMGDGKLQGEIYNAKEEILKLANTLCWTLIDYSYSELDKTSRSFMQSYRTKNKKEHILVFQKSC
ncbi:hypothetical protein DCO58_01075 [Helicobacter saguini]|uniref:Site-specific DNA-methyltransferase n=1 Tax=Helicobacter saguini TaxID=1548018 RepID=A0A347VR64_9HELI|nr:DNA methyltransferase [Helicobacter saguini]MWV63019.1 hypothetical protein [Helicobacter saguini]MWV66312.1 hypothetical protein [Helicobacter saguini]MWV68664.1 hypothetical protein [Helicobacter saguini]MWV71785.1 hypothetical protein [Helicobacter saguini]TLD95813.1 site-specific DNA-methyltransferase [Helicobacter saguini]